MEINFQKLLAAVEAVAEEADGVISNEIIASFFSKNIPKGKARELATRLIERLSAGDISIVSHADYERFKAMKAEADSIADASGLKGGESESSEDEETETVSAALSLEVDAQSRILPDIQRLARLPLLSDEQTKDLLVRVATCGDRQAEAKLIARNIRYVLFIARRYSRRRTQHLSLNDLVQEGILGLLEAIRRFDPNRGAKLSTYAMWWIRHHITRAIIDQDKTVRMPVYVYDRSRQLSHAYRKFYGTLGREPTDAEIALLAGMSPATVKTVRLALTQREFSLDAPFGVGESEYTRTHGEIIPDADGFERMERHLFKITADSPSFLRMFASLNTVAREVLFLHFARGWALAEVGKRFGFSRERIRQIGEQSKPKMRKALGEAEPMSPEEVAYIRNAITLAQEANKVERIPATLNAMRTWVRAREGRVSRAVLAILIEHGIVSASTEQVIELFWTARSKVEFAQEKIPDVKPGLANRFLRVRRTAWLASQARLGKLALGIAQEHFETLWPEEDWYQEDWTGTEMTSEQATDTQVQPIALMAIEKAIGLTERSLDELLDKNSEAFTQMLDEVEARIGSWRVALRLASGNTQSIERRLKIIEDRIRVVSEKRPTRGSHG